MIGNRRLILIVEDNAVTRRALQALFKSRGWAVSVAETVAEGLAQLDPPPDVIVLDLMLPDGDGEEVLREVRSRRLLSRVAITTAISDSERLDALSGLAPDAVLHKPAKFDEILMACS